MAKPKTQVDVLRGIESNIHITERQIYQLKIEFASLLISGQQSERRLILQQLHILQDNLKLLKVRQMFALEVVP